MKRRKSKIAQRQQERRRFSLSTSSMGMGPMSFDAEMARLHGWSEAEINGIWQRMEVLYRRYSWRSKTRHPERYVIAKDGTVIFVGPDKNGHALDPKKFR